MQRSPPPRRYLVADTGAAYVVAFISVHGDAIAITEHGTPASANAECLRLTKAARVAAFLTAAKTPAHRPRCARPVRCFPPDEFA